MLCRLKLYLPFPAQRWVCPSAGIHPMRYTDIAIIGGGLAGSTAAAMLGRAGIAAVLIDPHDPPIRPTSASKKSAAASSSNDFARPELPSRYLRSATHDGENWIARFGYLLDKRPSQQYGILYDALVNAIRAEIPRLAWKSIFAKAVSVSTSAERQKIVLSNDDDNLRTAGRARQRTERRIAPHARHRAPDRQRLPFHLDRIQHRAGRPPGLRIPGPDLFLGTAERPDRLHLRCSRSASGCGPTCSSIARSTIPGCSRCVARR